MRSQTFLSNTGDLYISQLTDKLLPQIRAAGLPEPVRELRFIEKRKFQFDLAWPDRMLAVECDGGVWIAGRHTRGAGFIRDHEKMNLAVLQGWRVLRFTPEHIKSGQALGWLEEALKKL